ncbi:helix-turn-helix domain-containing protein [Streptomyces sp. NBC_00503]|uniref:helix-turn-helix domain-containing protein n=1 Tax=Streptomyces sp. NBC_00503 TaxID=2903659 RepID=UPI002E818CDA|nr:helix-turn-helix transcriptional regulator [Streptomyces sp. NBC_00503]WUD82664.1 helix-turn-helix transcriptional regulator [Streptomyces sp. NBC_00503]
MAKSANKEAASGTTRLVAHLVRAFRKREGLTQEELGEMLGYSAAAISALETCAQPPSDEMLIRLEAVIGDGLGVFEAARELVRLDRYPPQFQDFAELEKTALAVSSYQPLVIDGIFQTLEYATALISGSFPPHSDLRVVELVGGRIARQSLFDRDPVALIELVVEEAVLTRRVGTEEVMRAQLLCLLSYARRRNVTVQVLPPNRGDRTDHVGLYGPLKLVETPAHERLVYLEVQDEGLLISDPAKVSMYSQRYAKIRAQALSPDESLGLIQELAGERQ